MKQQIVLEQNKSEAVPDFMQFFITKMNGPYRELIVTANIWRGNNQANYIIHNSIFKIPMTEFRKVKEFISYIDNQALEYAK